MKYRHGDIAISMINEAVDGEYAKELVLALGEHSGHRHILTVEKPEDMVVRKVDGGYVFTLKANGTLTHEEHKTITIAPGTYRSTVQREVDHFAKTTRRVQD